MKKILIILIISVSLMPADKDKAKNLYDSGYFGELIKYTGTINENDRDNMVLLFYRGLALFRTRDYREGKRIFDLVADNCAGDNSGLKDMALYYTALSKLKLEENIEGAVILTRLMNSQYPEISSNSRAILENLIYYKLEDADYKELSRLIFDSETAQYIESSRNALKILAVLPTTGPDQEAGKELLKGLEFGLKKFETKYKNLRLDVVNSEGKIAVMLKKVIEKLNSTRYNLMIGELRSDATSALAGIAEMKKIPLISPTATAKEISEVSDMAFQLNTTSYTFGRHIAEYAIDSLNYRTFAIISPLTEDGNESVSGFTSKVVEMGCSVISLEWYFDSFDLNKQIQRIREKVFSIDSLDTEEYMSTDSIKAVPAGIIDAFFLPVPNSDTESVLSQVSYYNFKAKTLGTYGWDDEKILNKLNMNADSLVFIKESSYSIDNPAYTDFAYKFRNEFNTNPKPLEVLGYSIIDMMTDLKNRYDELTVYKILSELEEYQAIAGKIIYENSRSNIAADLYMYRHGKGLRKLEFNERHAKDTLFEAKKLFNSGYVNEATRRYKEAVLSYENSLREYKKHLNLPDSLFDSHSMVSEIYRRAGNCYFILEEHSRAEEYFLKYLSNSPSDSGIRFKYYVSKANRETEDPSVILSEFTYDSRFSSEAYYEIGNIYLSRNDRKRAIKYYEVSAELKNKDAQKKIKILNAEKNKDNKFEW